MDSNFLRLFNQYNSLIERHHKAIQFFESNLDKVDAYIDSYRAIVNELCRMREEIEMNGYKMSEEEVLEGFRQIKALEG